MAPSMESFAKWIVWKARNEEKMAEVISERFNQKYGKYWHCLVIKYEKYICKAKFYTKNWIEIEVEDKNVIIFKSQLDEL